MTEDPLFYQVFKDLPELFLELVGEPKTCKSAYKYSAPDIKQTGFRLDGLLSTKSGYSFKPIYFIEAQGYKDDKKNFYDSFFGKIILYLTQYRPPNKQWYAVVIYDRRSREQTFPPYLSVFLPVLRRFYLDELAKTPNQPLSVGIMRLIVHRKQKENGRTCSTAYKPDKIGNQQCHFKRKSLRIYSKGGD